MTEPFWYDRLTKRSFPSVINRNARSSSNNQPRYVDISSASWADPLTSLTFPRENSSSNKKETVSQKDIKPESDLSNQNVIIQPPPNISLQETNDEIDSAITNTKGENTKKTKVALIVLCIVGVVAAGAITGLVIWYIQNRKNTQDEVDSLLEKSRKKLEEEKRERLQLELAEKTKQEILLSQITQITINNDKTKEMQSNQ